MAFGSCLLFNPGVLPVEKTLPFISNPSAAMKFLKSAQRSFFLCVLHLLFASCMPRPTFNNLSFLGDSITAGYLLSNVNERYATQLSGELGVTEVNGGMSGSTLTVAGGNNPGVNRYTSYVRSNGKYVVYIGINDVGRCTNQQFQDALTTVVQGLRTSYTAQDIILCNLAWTSYDNSSTAFFNQHMAFNNIIKTTAEAFNTKFCDVYSVTYNQPSLFIGNPPDPDAYLHPNAAGATVIKNALLSVINTPPSTKWIGPSGGNWNNAANWNGGAVPDTNTNVLISTNSVVVSDNAHCRSIQLNTGATITVKNGATLKIHK